MRQNILLAALSALTVTTAATRNFTIDVGAVKPSDKADWCNAEYNTCRLLCGGSVNANACDSTTLDYNCLCSNGSAPGLEYYIQSMPTFICEQAYSDCIAANTASSKKQDDCKTDIKSQCGTLDPTKAQVDTGSSDSSSSAASSSATQAATANQNAPTSTSSKAAAAAATAAYLGNGVAVVAAGVFAVML